MPPLTLADLRPIGQINHMDIAVAGSATGLGAWLIIEDTADGDGERLARLLYPSANALIDRVGFDARTWWCLPYVTSLDETLIALIDVAAEVRRRAGVVQLTLTGFSP